MKEEGKEEGGMKGRSEGVEVERNKSRKREGRRKSK